ncbi:MAG: hypothetical protein IT562_15945 [Alphaproteobacteria bacterium]|nr:hypothetical protein [Alphaproteobacteria bacterium]
MIVAPPRRAIGAAVVRLRAFDGRVVRPQQPGKIHRLFGFDIVAFGAFAGLQFLPWRLRRG